MMDEKVRFYQEALAADPRSTLFFALAELWVERGEGEKALALLRQGVENHPDHFRGRCLLVELLRGQGKASEAKQYLGQIFTTLGKSPGIWLAWAESLEAHDQKDAALAARFLAAVLRGESVSWTGVLEEGLRRTLSSKDDLDREIRSVTAPVLPAMTSGVSERPSVPVEPLALTETHSLSVPVRPWAENKGPEVDLGPLASELQPAWIPTQIPHLSDILVHGEPDEDETEDGPSIRTKTMADILAGQGDYVQALEIYEEVLAGADTENRRREISEAMTAIKKNQVASKEKKLLKTLEMLADRLESRVIGGE